MSVQSCDRMRRVANVNVQLPMILTMCDNLIKTTFHVESHCIVSVDLLCLHERSRMVVA